MTAPGLRSEGEGERNASEGRAVHDAGESEWIPKRLDFIRAEPLFFILYVQQEYSEKARGTMRCDAI